MAIKKALIYFVAAAASLLIFLLIKFGIDKLSALDSSKATYSNPKQIQYSFTLQNTSSKRIKNAEFWTYAPVKQTATQSCVRINSSHSYQLISDDLGNQILHYAFDNFPPFATKLITVKADLLLSNDSQPVFETDLSSYLQPEKYIESDNAEINRMAQKLKTSGRLNTAQNIYRWVGENVQYAGYVSHARGARYALVHKKGDCTEFTYLFAALCRANQIPARAVGGYICKASATLKPAAYHNWAEFYHNGIWKMADPQNRVFGANDDDYIAMRIITDSSHNSVPQFQRFGFKGEGLRVKMN